VLAVLPAAEGEVLSRAGFTLTRRFGNAVARNRTRRRLQAIVYPLLAGITPPRLIVTIPRGRAVQASAAELQREWLRLARRAGLLTDGGDR
jgi:ribonuclease P protein component